MSRKADQRSPEEIAAAYEAADHNRYNTWKSMLKSLFNASHEDYPDEEEMAIHHDRGRTAKAAFDLIMAERTGDED
jgi:hypothetical protein